MKYCYCIIFKMILFCIGSVQLNESAQYIKQSKLRKKYIKTESKSFTIRFGYKCRGFRIFKIRPTLLDKHGPNLNSFSYKHSTVKSELSSFRDLQCLTRSFILFPSFFKGILKKENVTNNHVR